VWGDDLRIEGVVVEQLDGVDDLPEVVRAFRPEPDPPARRTRRPPRRRVQGVPHRRHRGRRSVRRPRPRGRAPLRRRVAGGEAGRARHRGVAAGAEGTAVEGGRLRGAGLAARHAPRSSLRPGGASSAPSRATPTSSRRCWAGSRS
jgi:hypothetical protein